MVIANSWSSDVKKTDSVSSILLDKKPSSKQDWQTLFIDQKRFYICDWQNHDIAEIVAVLVKGNSHMDCPYEEIYIVFPTHQRPDKVFTPADGFWGNASDHLLALSEEEKEKILVLFVPQEEVSSKRLTQEDYLPMLPVFQQELEGITIKSLS